MILNSRCIAGLLVYWSLSSVFQVEMSPSSGELGSGIHFFLRIDPLTEGCLQLPLLQGNEYLLHAFI